MRDKVPGVHAERFFIKIEEEPPEKERRRRGLLHCPPTSLEDVEWYTCTVGDLMRQKH
jgi:hypothetical protein